MSVYKFDCDACGRGIETQQDGTATCGKCGKKYEVVWPKSKVSEVVKTAAESKPQAPGV